MSKTIDLQVEKCRALIDGLRNHQTEADACGITSDSLDALDRSLAALAQAGSECDALRSELAEKVRRTNALLVQIKDTYADTKKKVKGRYPQEEWPKYGVMDKR